MTAYTAPSDPTNVVGKRIGAWVIDLVIYSALAFVFAAAVGGVETLTYERPPADFCDTWQEENTGYCFRTETADGEATATTIEGLNNSAIFWGLHLLGYSVIQGLTGGSLGKLALGLRVVDEQGKTIGIGRSLVRTIAWIIDAITFGIPIVGGAMVVSTKGHRRVGDMVAGTYVVGKDDVGTPVGAGSAPAPAPGAWGTPAGGASWPAAGGGLPGGPADSNPWNPPANNPVSGPPVGESPGAGSPFGAAPASAPSPGGGEGPQWDAARNAYIQFDRDRGVWLQWDDNLKTWSPISQ